MRHPRSVREHLLGPARGGRRAAALADLSNGVAGAILTGHWVARRAGAWIVRQRDLHRPHAGPITTDIAARFDGYFRASTLAPVRVRFVPRIDPPWPIDVLDLVGRQVIDFDRLWGLCFVDTVVLATDRVAEEAIVPNLFHECVHVAQYHEYGVARFLQRYAREWVASGYRYAEIGLERQAFDMQRRFEGGGTFSVEEEVVVAGA